MKKAMEKIKNFVEQIGLILQVFVNGEQQYITFDDDCCFGKTNPGDEVELRVHIPNSPPADVEVVQCGFQRIQPRKGQVDYKRIEAMESSFDGMKLVSFKMNVVADDEGNGICTWPGNQFSLLARRGLKLFLLQLSASYDKDRKLGEGYDGYYIVDPIFEGILAKDSNGHVIVRDGQFMQTWKALLPHIEKAYSSLKAELVTVDAKTLQPPAALKYSKFSQDERYGGWAKCRFFNKSMRKGALEMYDRDGELDGRVVVVHAQSLVDQEGFRFLEEGDKVWVKYVIKQGSTGYAEAREVSAKQPERRRRERRSLADYLNG